MKAANKWTKLGPCLDKILCGTLLHRLLADVFEALGDNSNLGDDFEGQEPDGDAGGDARYEEDLHFTKVQSRRYKAAKEMLRNNASRLAI